MTFRLLPAALLGVALVLAMLSSCAYSRRYPMLGDSLSAHGEPFEFMTTTAFGIHFMLEALPLFGDGSLDEALDTFEEDSEAAHATRIRIAETSTTIYWWVLPPLSFLFPPVVSRVTGDIIEPAREADEVPAAAPDVSSR
jgi:hypothetical protein